MSAEGHGARIAEEQDPADPAFERLLDYLKEMRAFDFTGYKRASLMRRVRQHMQRAQIASFEDYHDFLQVHPEEFTALFNTILINVTSFFRDADTWSYLRDSALPQLLETAGSRPIRLWSAGCATGQEAYSLAMALSEMLGTETFRARVKIYATDVDEQALAIARQASYSERELTGLPPEHLEKYFEKVGANAVFRKDLRRCIIFGRNDLVQDAPISRIDLLACRNTLMYFTAETQARIVSRLEFALNPDGLLILGKAEMLLNHTATFEPLDLKCRVFRKAPSESRPAAAQVPSAAAAAVADRDQALAALRSEAFLTSAVAQLVINDKDELVLINHRARALLALTEADLGRPFRDLQVSYQPAELRSQLNAVRQAEGPIRLRDVEWTRSVNERLFFDIQLVPLVDARSRSLGVSIIFNDVTRYRQLRTELESTNRQLETAYQELQSTNEELETTNEELQSTVEELETTNEELQSTNEELETMNEELRSMNDELQSTNDELRERTAEITALSDFTRSILGSLVGAIVVLDRDLTVQVWNREAEELWGLREAETVGTSLISIDSGMPVNELRPLIDAAIGDATFRSEVALRVLNRRGREIGLQISVTSFLDGSRQPIGALLFMQASEAGPQHRP